MSKPIKEGSVQTQFTGVGFRTSQLERRATSGAVTNGPWHYVGSGGGEPAFGTDWDNIGDPIVLTRFRLNGLGEVEIELGCEGGAPDSVIFVLPVSFRPIYTQEFAVSDGVGGCTDVRVDSDGNVYWAVT